MSTRRHRAHQMWLGIVVAVALVSVAPGAATRRERTFFRPPDHTVQTASGTPRRLVLHEFSWPRSTPEAQGLDKTVLDSYRDAAATGLYGAVDSLLVFRHGALVHESYFRGWAANELHPCYSVTKSFTSLLVGQARARGLAIDRGDEVLAFFPEYSSVANLTPAKSAITVDDLLTMRAGFEWHELDRSYSDPTNSVALMAARPDWVKYALDRPMVASPGTLWEYSSGSTVVIGGILRNVSGRQPHELAREWLFAPLEIRSWAWDLANDGLSNCGWGLHLAPRDMAKLGELVLRGGRWRGRELIPAEWLASATSHHAEVPGSSYGYGYQWWRLPLDRDLPEGDTIVFAWGYGGQFVFVVPSLDVVVVSTGSCYDGACSGAISFIRPMLANAVLPGS